jgi:Na+-translocating ferredoxin:NAD+ oxidoreductase subunit B
MLTVKDIDKILPQTQCQACGYKACLPYAKALLHGKTTIDKCAPGGVITLNALADLLGQSPEPYIKSVENNSRTPEIAGIVESECIGCTKCIQACPVDAIVGSAKFMHSIISDICTGCGLCLEPCPMDCIELIPLENSSYDKDLARQNYLAKKDRIKAARSQKKHKKLAVDPAYFLQAINNAKS